MTLRFGGKYGIDRVPQRLPTSRDGHKVSVDYNSLIKCALDALCHTHTHTHVITQGEKIETSTDLKFNPLAKDANHSLIMYVCVCLCVLGGRRAQDLVSSHFYYLLCLHEGFEQRERTERER